MQLMVVDKMKIEIMKKHLLTYLLTCTMLFSCTENVENDIFNEKVKQVQQEKDLVYYQKSFAKILSKLVSSEESVRYFIKEEALLQFDRDYDVFYHYVKNKMMKGDTTFRDFLLLHCPEAELS